MSTEVAVALIAAGGPIGMALVIQFPALADKWQKDRDSKRKHATDKALIAAKRDGAE